MSLTRRIKSVVTVLGLRVLGRHYGGAFSLYLDQQHPTHQDYGELESIFETSTGLSIPIYANYRFQVKAGWQYYGSLQIMEQLKRAGQLTKVELDFFHAAIGSRTINISIDAANEAVQAISQRLPELFVLESVNDPEYLLLRTTEKEQQKTVQLYVEQHASMLKQLAAAKVVYIPAGAALLEIGFMSGGHSTFAFEQLGMRASAVDNQYGGLTDDSALHEYNKRTLSSKVEFRQGDITKKTSFESESFDVIYSASVLEHVQDLKSAFSEMYRLLKPGGVIIHNYAPFFSHNGAHALGIGDSPWAHVRMNIEDYMSYIEKLRPNEAVMTRDWFSSAMHQDMPQWKVQRLVAEAGFRIALWKAKPSAKRWLRDLTPEVIRDCFAATPEIGIEDLTSQSVSFVGIKP